MTTATMTQTTQVTETIKVIPQQRIELNLDNILAEEFSLGLPSNINLGF